MKNFGMYAFSSLCESGGITSGRKVEEIMCCQLDVGKTLISGGWKGKRGSPAPGAECCSCLIYSHLDTWTVAQAILCGSWSLWWTSEGWKQALTPLCCYEFWNMAFWLKMHSKPCQVDMTDWQSFKTSFLNQILRAQHRVEKCVTCFTDQSKAKQ